MRGFIGKAGIFGVWCTVVWSGSPFHDSKIAAVRHGIDVPPVTEQDWNEFRDNVIELSRYREAGATAHPMVLAPLQTGLQMILSAGPLTWEDSLRTALEVSKAKVDSLLASQSEQP